MRPRGALVALLSGAMLAAACAQAAAAAGGPATEARAAVLIEASTGRQLYGLNASERLPIASTTKLMTALVTLDHVRRLDTMFSQNTYYLASADSQIGLVPGERMSVRDLLLALLVPSADDAAEDLAYNVGHRSVARFVAMMNAQARRLRLTHTHYATPSGLDTPGNYSSASDLARLARYLLLHHPFIARAVAMPSAVLRTGNHVRRVQNRNDLVGRIRWVNGVKTGHTLDAGYVLVGSGTRDGMTLLSVVLGTDSVQTRDAGTLALLDYGFANFRLVRPIRRGAVLARLPVRAQPRVRAVLVAGAGVSRVIPRRASVAVKIELTRRLAAPLPRGAVLGSALVVVDGRAVARVPLVLADALHRPPAPAGPRFLRRPTTLVSVGVLLVLVIGLALVRRGRARTRSAARPEPVA